MHWFLDPITKHYADFEGRVGRQEFWMFILFSWILQVILSVLHLDMVGFLVSLGLFLPSFALGARRLHDIGKSGWWQLLWLVPIIGWIIIIVWCATKTDGFPNQYGNPAVPKMAASAAAAAPTPAPAAADTTPAASSEVSSVTPDTDK